MSDSVSYVFPTTGLATLKGNFINVAGQIVKASDGTLIANNATNRALASIVGTDAVALGTYLFHMQAQATAGTYRLLVWFDPTWADGEDTLSESGALSWDGTDLTDGSATGIPAEAVSMLNRGPNAGISGDVEFPTIDGVWKFKVYAIGDSWDLNMMPDAGRGDGDWPAQIPGSASGTITMSGKVTKFAFPNPDSLNGQTLSVTKKLYTGVTETMNVRVFKRGVSHKEADGENWDITITGQILSMPVSAGWPGSQVSSTDDTFADKMMWSGMSKTLDPATVVLQEGATERLPVRGVVDSDSAEIAALQAHFADTTPVTGLKLRPLRIERVSANIVYLHYQWSLTNTNDDVLNPQTRRTEDPSGLASHEVTSALNAVPGDGTIAGLVSRGITYIKHNDAAVQQVKEWGVRSTIEDITFPGSPTSTDKLGSTGSTIALQMQKASTQVTANANEPTWTPGGTYKKREWSFTQHTNAGGLYVHRISAGLTTVQEDVENQSSNIFIDPSGLGSYETHGRVVASASTADPDSGSVTSGLVLTGTHTKEVHDNAFHRTFRYGLLTNAQQIEYQGTHSFGDTSGNLAPPTSTPSVVTTVQNFTAGEASSVTLQTSIAAAQAITTRPFKTIHVSRMTPLRSVVRTEIPGDDFKVFEGDPNTTIDYHSRNEAGNAVPIWDGVARTASTSRLLIGHYTHYTAHWPIVIRRWRRTTNPITLKYNGIIGSACADTGTGAVITCTVANGVIATVTVGTAGSGYTTGAVGCVVVGGGGHGGIITATTSTTSGVTSAAITNAGEGYTSTPTVYVTGGATFLEIPSACIVFRGAEIQYSLREMGVAHWVCIDYKFEVNSITNSGSLVDGNISNGNIPMDVWVEASCAAGTSFPSDKTSTDVRTGYVGGHTPLSSGWGVFFGQ